jgi:hypothetical protein
VTIKRGEEWGTTVARPDDLVVARSDAELAQLVRSARDAALGLAGGDLHRSVGAPDGRDPVQRLPIDALLIDIDGERVLAVAHVVAMRSWWRGAVVAVMNCGQIGEWDMAPRAHPNDGRFDVVEIAPSMSLRHRLQARSRLPHGTHVPHPDIGVRTAEHAAWTFARPTPVVIDGIERGRATRLAVRISPDHFAIHV